MYAGSPFPGVDPYLPGCWGAFQVSFISRLTEELNELLPQNLVALINHRMVLDRGRFVLVESAEENSTRVGGPDAVAKPELVDLTPVKSRQHYIDIVIPRTSEPVVTTIELVSPANKRSGDSRRQYRQRQSAVYASSTNLVEIDWVRGGGRTALAERRVMVGRASKPFRLSIRRAQRPEFAELYRVGLRDALPCIHIPTRNADGDVVVDFQRLFDETYRRGRFADVIDYSTPSMPALAAADQAWADERVREWKSRIRYRD